MKLKPKLFAEIKEPFVKAVQSLWRSVPILLGVVLLISLISSVIPSDFYSRIFSNIPLLDSVIGAFFGSISAGNSVTSYVVGGEMLSQGISLIAVTAFIIAWVTVGVVQIPAESMLLGKKFSVLRNATSFLLAIIIAVIVVGVYNLI